MIKKILTILLSLLSINAFSQKKFFDKNDILIYSSQFISGYFDGWHEGIVYHQWGASKQFFNYENSWKRKYRNYDAGDLRPAFPGAKTWLVGFTDGNHMTRGVSRIFMTGSIFIAMGEKDNWKERLKEIIIASIINRAGFALAYKYIYK